MQVTGREAELERQKKRTSLVCFKRECYMTGLSKMGLAGSEHKRLSRSASVIFRPLLRLEVGPDGQI